MLIRWLCYFSLILFSTTALASKPLQCKRYSFLTYGLNISDYAKCKMLVNQCPAQGIFPKESCVKRVIKKNPEVCAQIKKLAHTLKMPVTMITAKRAGKFSIIRATYIADGQNRYYIVSPAGCMIDTNIDPRKISPSLAKQYHKVSFLTVNWNEPKYQTHRDGSQSFEARLRVTKTCLACPIIGWAKIKFNFLKNGQLKNVTLESFKKSGSAPPSSTRKR